MYCNHCQPCPAGLNVGLINKYYDLAVAGDSKGLCVAVLMIQDRPGFQQDTGKPDLTTTTAVRLLLDKAADVEEAVDLLSQYDMHASAGMMVHFALADASGHSVVVEYIDNEMAVTETPVVTNYYLSPGEKYGIGTEESMICCRAIPHIVWTGCGMPLTA